ncbi:50S ribosomal protein L3 N(5)-glutamine methyltransferase [Limnohabitans sp. MMS-10A-178]|jgi:ribosomal protein L3 glutamine methyltransferase|uniref:50S ribosomal protein L3 N(5)-glutamine methyltransferase n=1 Tax=Limnohabitans sp. MMS-10A-178 TaxID=1835767 RepID=UPI000D3B56FF|nr:50S ribosomal protein L3 N(5)-glutamine methyltransferase [Limnohabitans sp. MMS-10A-178]PUE14866.1 50S ribosomal protein L3 N(5)-glutamine methyltransferase [Limnohabitans sp. MMS-10A-178]
MDLKQLIQTSADQLEQAQIAFGQGTLTAIDEATWLVLWQLQLPLDLDLTEDLQQLQAQVLAWQPKLDVVNLSLANVQACQALIAKRIQTRKPAAYLTQEAWLQGISFYVDERSIVPRSFIAELIADGAFDGWLSESSHSFLDLCTGNGSLAILCAMAYPDIQVTAADISKDALDVAKINVEKHQLTDRIQLVESDGLKNLSQKFDCIICNPPYVCEASMQKLPEEFLAEPSLALAGGSDGMDFIQEMLIDLPVHMNDQAILVLEIGNEREHFEAAFPRLEAVWLDTSAGEDQVLLLTKEALLKFKTLS